MIGSPFKARRCLHCREQFQPMSANQRTHRDCFSSWRRTYQRRYQRRVRRDLKRSWEECANDEA